MKHQKEALRFIELLSSGCFEHGPWEQINLDEARNCYDNLNTCINSINTFDYIIIIDELVKDRVAKNLFGEIAEDWVAYLNLCFRNNHFDKRDEEAVKLGNILFNETGIYSNKRENEIRKIIVADENDLTINEYIVKTMSKNHSTLKQAFSAMVFYFLEKYGRDSVKEDILEAKEIYNLDDNWYILPII